MLTNVMLTNINQFLPMLIKANKCCSQQMLPNVNQRYPTFVKIWYHLLTFVNIGQHLLTIVSQMFTILNKFTLMLNFSPYFDVC